MKRILQISSKSKVRKAKATEVKSLKEYGVMDVDSKVALIQELIPLGLMHIEELLKEEVLKLAGGRYSRDGISGYDRWGRQRGSVYILDQKVPIIYQRIRDTINKREVPLTLYEQFQEPRNLDEGLFRKVLHGLSCRNYKGCAEAVPGAFSLSASTVSRRYIEASRTKLKEIMKRRLDVYDFTAIIMDGKTFGEDEIIMAVGVDMKGNKVPLGIIQSSTENHKVIREFLNDLIDRGLKYDKGLLCVIDGAKGFKKAIQEVFGIYGIIQRCQWHKRENVISYLPKGMQAEYRRKLQAVYSKDTYEKAKAALLRIKAELNLINESAVKSLEEGLEETLTILKLGMHKEMLRSFTTTNMIESIHALVEQMTGKVDYWKNSNQKQRWVASSLLHIEQRLNRVNGHRHLAELREALQREIEMKAAVGREAVAA